jgi:hypothetical protein
MLDYKKLDTDLPQFQHLKRAAVMLLCMVQSITTSAGSKKRLSDGVAAVLCKVAIL